MKLSKIFFAFTLAVAGVAVSTSSTLATSNSFAQATASLNVRTGPSTNFDILDTLHRGELMQTHECQQGWCFVSHAGPDGWVAARYLHEVSAPGVDYTPSHPITPWPVRSATTPLYDSWLNLQIPWKFQLWQSNPNSRHPMPTEPEYQTCNYTSTHYKDRSDCMMSTRSNVHLGSQWSRNIISLWTD